MFASHSVSQYIYLICLQENGQSRLRQAQDDVEEIKVIMLDNMSKADERAGKLGDLEDRADKLLQHVSLYYHIDSLYCHLINII